MIYIIDIIVNSQSPVPVHSSRKQNIVRGLELVQFALNLEMKVFDYIWFGNPPALTGHESSHDKWPANWVNCDSVMAGPITTQIG